MPPCLRGSFRVAAGNSPDATAKDAENRETLGYGSVRWHMNNPALVNVGGNHTHQVKLTVRQAGDLDLWATLDGAQSNTINFRFRTP